MKPTFLKLVVLIVISVIPTICLADQASHLKAAQDLIASININKTMTETVDRMVALEVQKNPQLGPFKDIMRDFFLKYMTGDVLTDFISKLYVEEFSEKELNELTAFYKTSTGQKAIKKLPVLTQKGAIWGQKQVNDNIDELRTLIAEESKRLEKMKESSSK